MARGQAAVLYDGDTVLGSGTISGTRAGAARPGGILPLTSPALRLWSWLVRVSLRIHACLRVTLSLAAYIWPNPCMRSPIMGTAAESCQHSFIAAWQASKSSPEVHPLLQVGKASNVAVNGRGDRCKEASGPREAP